MHPFRSTERALLAAAVVVGALLLLTPAASSGVDAFTPVVGSQEPAPNPIESPSPDPRRQPGPLPKQTARPPRDETSVPADPKTVGKPKVSATLVDPEKNSGRQTATVAVKVSGVEVVDPATVNEQPKKGQAHFHYQLDSGPVIATTATKLSFHELSPGDHRIVVMLAGNDHAPLGAQETVSLRIPAPGDEADKHKHEEK
jgi:hypothetical protein